MAIIDTAFSALQQLNLWFKVQNNDDLTLSDIPELIPLRWFWLRDNWSFMKASVETKIPTYSNPQLLRAHIDDFSNFIDLQRNNNYRGNPLLGEQRFLQFQAMFEVISLSEIDPTNEERKLISDTVNKIKNLNRTDFFSMIKAIRQGREEQSDYAGGNDPTYDAAMNRSGFEASRTPTPRDIQEMLSFQDAIKAIEFILANNASFSQSGLIDPFALAKDNADNPDYEIQSHQAGTLVRMQYGDNLQTLAARYLGDEDRWVELAITNGLKPPYIDEVGQTIPLIASASGNQINIAKNDATGAPNLSKLFINQRIFLHSDTYPFPEQRTILNMRQIPVSGEIIMELSGELDLERYQLSEGAFIRVFKPNTTNSMFFIMIPTDDEVQKSLNETPWFLQAKAEDEKQSGVDIALNETGDIYFTSGGDITLSYGLSNAIQALQLKMVTEQGTLNRHPNFGLLSVVGSKTTDLEAQRSALTQSILDSVEADDRFAAVSQIDVFTYTDSNTTGFIVQLVVRLAGSGTPIPISFTVNPS